VLINAYLLNQWTQSEHKKEDKKFVVITYFRDAIDGNINFIPNDICFLKDIRKSIVGL